MKFKTAFSYLENEEKTYTPSGEKIVYEHREEIDLKGKRTLVKDRAVNIYEVIQASAESCDIQNIIKRATEGDLNVLNQIQANYIDVTDAPQSLAAAQQLVIKAKNEFEKLPYELKIKYNNNAMEYVADYGSESWEEKTGLKAMKEKKAKREKVEKEIMGKEKALKDIVKEETLVNE